MVKIQIKYEGDLHCTAIHEPSRRKMETDAPVDNNGRGESFSPTDLVATAFGACMATIMGIIAKRHQIALEGMKIEVVKEMSADTPRRISQLLVRIEVPGTLTAHQRELLEKAALTCPVYHSLHPDIEKVITFHWSKD